MKQIIKILNIMLSYAILGANAFALEASPINASRCISCHEQDLLRGYPKLAGQNSQYFIRQMLAFKNGKRENSLMQAITADLNMFDIEQLAIYFSQQKISHGLAQNQSIERGQVLYRYGDKTQGLPACMACHGPAAEGNSLAAIPMLSGQYAEYTRAQLLAYKTKTRQTDAGGIMRDIAERLTEKDIWALANYIGGLHRLEQ